LQTPVTLQGRQEGRQEGLQEGRQEGLLKGEAKMLGLMLGHRFGDLSDAVVNRLKDASEDQLKEWLISAITAPSLEDVFKDDTTN
jgi:predicted transposase YdaD